MTAGMCAAEVRDTSGLPITCPAPPAAAPTQAMKAIDRLLAAEPPSKVLFDALALESGAARKRPARLARPARVAPSSIRGGRPLATAV
eukprot:CAMPEP_0170285872 /NCGR_PEP_ID=MMETSP0116_2-20130129/42990_1 /TAXON_ID=400756 /ORGANISM="Durinskia baltica, Strain CSIRO CS-38" /LENGTH=87 /DNA_ID=CAMNT_0010537283 /DNA_START=88 /DNA_END=347 /DNA_ORIENTATION=-